MGAFDYVLPNMQYGPYAHTVGTCRMGDNELTSVVDRNLRIWDTENIYICDNSVIPTTLPSHPVLALTSLSLRLTDYLLTSPYKSKYMVEIEFRLMKNTPGDYYIGGNIPELNDWNPVKMEDDGEYYSYKINILEWTEIEYKYYVNGNWKTISNRTIYSNNNIIIEDKYNDTFNKIIQLPSICEAGCINGICKIVCVYVK